MRKREKLEMVCKWTHFEETLEQTTVRLEPTVGAVCLAGGHLFAFREMDIEEGERYDLVLVPREEDKDELDRELARLGFEAYNEQAGGKTWDGKDIPPFDEVGEAVQANWIAGAKAIREALEG